MDTAGNVYVAKTKKHQVYKFSSTGKLLAKWGSYARGDGQLNNLCGIAVDSVGNVYVVDTWNQQGQVFHTVVVPAR